MLHTRVESGQDDSEGLAREFRPQIQRKGENLLGRSTGALQGGQARSEFLVHSEAEVKERPHLLRVGNLATALLIDPASRLSSRLEGRPSLEPRRKPSEEISAASFVDEVRPPPSQGRLAQGFAGPGNRQL